MQACLSDSPLHCRCDIKKVPMADGAVATYYPRAGCLRIQRKLYNIRSFCDCFGKHFWEMLVSHRGNGTIFRVVPWPKHGVIYLSISVWAQNERAGMMVPMLATVGEIAPIVSVWRIQRAARCYIRRRFEARALAVAMATHSRLGRDSGLLAAFPCDVLSLLI
jgi:hypothetical protein